MTLDQNMKTTISSSFYRLLLTNRNLHTSTDNNGRQNQETSPTEIKRFFIHFLNTHNTSVLNNILFPLSISFCCKIPLCLNYKNQHLVLCFQIIPQTTCTSNGQYPCRACSSASISLFEGQPKNQLSEWRVNWTAS